MRDHVLFQSHRGRSLGPIRSEVYLALLRIQLFSFWELAFSMAGLCVSCPSFVLNSAPSPVLSLLPRIRSTCSTPHSSSSSLILFQTMPEEPLRDSEPVPVVGLVSEVSSATAKKKKANRRKRGNSAGSNSSDSSSIDTAIMQIDTAADAAIGEP